VPPVLVDGRLARATSNALTMQFRNGPGAPLATARQGAADGRGKKFGILLGFKNGGPGTHVLTFSDGSVLHVTTRDTPLTTIARADGVEIATTERGEHSQVRRAGGAGLPWFVVSDDPERPKDLDAFHLVVDRGTGERLGRLEVVRTVAGWSLAQDLIDTTIWWGRAGAPMKLPMLGTRLVLDLPVDELELQVLCAVCVDLAIGLRPYAPSMR
jgi:hypothetical protein